MGLSRRAIDRYAAATNGDDIEAYRSEGVVPPTYGATWETALVLDILAEAGTGLPTRGLIHLESDLVQIRGLTLEDGVRCRLELERTEAVSSGSVLTLRSRTWNGVGQLCTEASMALLLRGDPDPAAGSHPKRAGVAFVHVEGWEELERWQLAGGDGRKYARASGDYNPIHLWRLTARPFGFSRPILQGFCIQAMVANALIRGPGNGDPASLRRLGIAFRSPLPLPSQVRLLVARGGSNARRFRVCEMDDAGRVFAEGEAVCGS